MQDPGWSYGRKKKKKAHFIRSTSRSNMTFGKSIVHWRPGLLSDGLFTRKLLCTHKNTHLRQHSINGVPTLCQHQVFVEHEVERESLAEGVRADPGLLRAVLLEAIQVLVERLFLRVLLFDQKLDVVTLFALWLNHLQQLKV